jgi:hypothetical protein
MVTFLVICTVLQWLAVGWLVYDRYQAWLLAKVASANTFTTLPTGPADGLTVVAAPALLPSSLQVNVTAAVAEAIAANGLNVSYTDPAANLLASGKFDEVLYHASSTLGAPLRTTGDLIDLLARRFED